MKLKVVFLLIFLNVFSIAVMAQNILPSPMFVKNSTSKFILEKEGSIAFSQESIESANYLSNKLNSYFKVNLSDSDQGDIILSCESKDLGLGKEGYTLSINDDRIKITSNTNTGIFYGIQSLLQLLPNEIQAGKPFTVNKIVIDGLEVKDEPKYSWRSFMLDSGRQYQTPEFIKKYLRSMAMLKMNVFHWHLTEGMGWRIEIKKYPLLTEIGSKIMDGKEQHGYYSQEEIKNIVQYAKKLHITVVPEIDIPGHSEAALIAYPEMSCFGVAPSINDDYTFTHNLLCAGREETYEFIQDVLDEVCTLFPSEYIHLGGDEAPKQNWDKCKDCQNRIQKEKLKNTQDLQLYFSSRLASYLKTKGKKVIFWGDVVCQDGTTSLPDNVVVQWWNWLGKRDTALINAIERGHSVICNSSHFTYLNYPLTPWEMYRENKTFDLELVYENNPSDITLPDEKILGMGTCLWTNCNVVEGMVDKRVFPRIYALSEQMWSKGKRLPFEEFYERVQSEYSLLKLLNIDYGPALKSEVPKNFSWNKD